MVDSAPELTFRNFDREHDVAAVVELLIEIQRNGGDANFEEVSEEALHEQFTWAGYMPERDSWVVTTSDAMQVVGYGSLFKYPIDPHPDIYIGVHPDWRRRGIGGALLDLLEKWAREAESLDIGGYPDPHDEGTLAFVRKRGYEPAYANTRLSVAGQQSFPAPELPAGFALRTYAEINDIDVFVESGNRCFEGQGGHRHTRAEDMVGWLATLKHEEIFLLFAPDGAVVGEVRAGMSEPLSNLRGQPTGYVDAPGVAIAYRSANLYLPLLLFAIHTVLPKYPVAIELESWGDTPETLELYKTLGFAVMQESIAYRRAL